MFVEMNLRRIAGLMALSVLLLCVSCKEDEEETKLYFNGSPTFSLPVFVQAGELMTLTPSTVTRADDDDSTLGLGCYWKMNTPGAVADTIRREDASSLPYSYSFSVPDTLMTMEVTCTIFADGYNNTSSSSSAIIIRTEGDNRSVQGIVYPEGTKIFTDPRDDVQYHYITVDGRDWMADNLRWKGAGYSYYDMPAVDPLFGRYYSWAEASTACPAGWRLPSNEDFLSLNNAFVETKSTVPNAHFNTGAGNHMAPAYFNNTVMWEYWPDVDVTNKSGMSLLPMGYIALSDGGDALIFNDILTYCLLWTSDSIDEEKAYFRALFERNDRVTCEIGYKNYMAMNVRCIRTAE